MPITDLLNGGRGKKCMGLIREGKLPPDRRVALTPQQAATLQATYPQDLHIMVESSEIRCFNDNEYRELGLSLVVPSQLADCDILFGIKEVPVSDLIAHKTYFFFSHTTKKQPYNRELLQTILEKQIQLIDYELLKDEQGKRLIGFGVHAGNVGAHYALMMVGKRYGLFDLPPAWQCQWKSNMLERYAQYQFPHERFVVTGRGRVGQGAVEVLNAAGIFQVKPREFLEQDFDMPVYTVVDVQQLYCRPDGKPFENETFYQNPEAFQSAFAPFTRRASVLINGMYWDKRAPRLFEMADLQREDFTIRTIADVTCDINGSVPANIRETTSEAPFYGIDRSSLEETAPFYEETIDVMAISNLPNELAFDASQHFGKVLTSLVIPLCLFEPNSPVLRQATIAQDGQLMPDFTYLEDFVNDG